MAGANLTAAFDVVDALRGVRAMRAFARDMAPLSGDLGAHLAQSTRQRFNEGRDPQGNPWKALLPAYAEIKRGPGILVEQGMSGGLQGSIRFHADAAGVVVGSNKVYAAAHQFGAVIRPKSADGFLAFRLGMGRHPTTGKSMGSGMVFAKKVTIPARPYLGISGEDREELTALAEDFLHRLLSR